MRYLQLQFWISLRFPFFAPTGVRIPAMFLSCFWTNHWFSWNYEPRIIHPSTLFYPVHHVLFLGAGFSKILRIFTPIVWEELRFWSPAVYQRCPCRGWYLGGLMSYGILWCLVVEKIWLKGTEKRWEKRKNCKDEDIRLFSDMLLWILFFFVSASTVYDDR